MVLILPYKNPSYNLSRHWKKYRQATVMLARSSVPRETQTPVTTIYMIHMIPKRLPSQNSKVQNSNLCRKF